MKKILGTEIKTKGFFSYEESELEIPGELRIDMSGKITVDLYGQFTDGIKETWAHYYKPKVLKCVFGRLENSYKYITLFNCNYYSNGHSGGFILCSSAILGKLYKSIQDVKLKKVIISFLNIEKWLDINGLNVSSTESNIKISHQHLKPMNLKINHELNIKIIFDWQYYIEYNKKMEVSEEKYICLEFPKKQSISDVMRFCYRLKTLICLLENKSIYFTAVNIPWKYKWGKKYITENAYFVFPQDIDDKQLQNYESRFCFTEIKEIFSAAFAKWIEISNKNNPMIDILFNNYLASKFVDQKFLAIISTIEAFHRNNFILNDNEKNAHQERINRILSVLENQDKNWVSEKLKYSGDPSLRRRLKDLVEKYLQNYNEILEKNDIDKIVTLRNDLAHGKGLKYNNQELIEITEKTYNFLEHILLYEIGIKLKN